MKFLSRDFDLEFLTSSLRALSGVYEQAARAAASARGCSVIQAPSGDAQLLEGGPFLRDRRVHCDHICASTSRFTPLFIGKDAVRRSQNIDSYGLRQPTNS
jgi:hypothetical protein